ncbi:amphi-Trp domain-containing protein [Haloarchaeobius sp. TZWWS8]|uniref:amphi-Trp domain-containing protein n=1 Tax=Haloarchaeobius sp. TZWWS8 TaxID=3446121 RepID=UPI003EB74CD0
MADKTTSSETLTRSELASHLRELADRFEEESESVTIPVGNKSVTVTPPAEVGYEVTVVERSSLLRGNKESIDLELSWKGTR